MNKINLLTLYNVNQMQSINDSRLDKIKSFFNLKDIKQQEIEDLMVLCELFMDKKPSCNIYENYYINYKLPHISKEFDLLKLGDDKIANIELKSQIVDESSISKQLNRNYHYLSSLKKQETLCFAFVSENKSFFIYDSNSKEIKEICIKKVISELENIIDSSEILDDLFTPKDFLISPFNNTQDFLDDKYFLTQQQEDIEKDIISKINKNNGNVFSISGAAGTGKTLLTYDLAKKLRENKKVCIVHCAQSNEGIETLQQKGWNIETIKNFPKILEDEISEIIIFDESQRLHFEQLEKILQIDKIVIFSHDVQQRLNKINEAEKVVDNILVATRGNQYTLSDKIRHNKKLASFIKKLFDLKKIKYDNEDYDDVIIHYERDAKSAKYYMSYLNEHWKHIHLTPDKYGHRKIKIDDIRFFSDTSAHAAIGQEYDNVVVIINEGFYYDNSDKLAYKENCHYPPIETLFQAITRVRRKLLIVIIGNEKVYLECMRIKNRNDK